MEIKLLGERVLIEVESKETKTESGLIVPPKNEPGDMQTGVVVAVGLGKVDSHGNLIEMTVEVGDRVMFQYANGVTVEGKSYMLVNEADIVMVLS